MTGSRTSSPEPGRLRRKERAIDVTVHYDNRWSFADPHLWVWYDDPGLGPDDVGPSGHDGFGAVFTFRPGALRFHFMAKDGAGAFPAAWEDSGLRRISTATPPQAEVWCRGDRAFVYEVEPRKPEPISAASFLSTVTPAPGTHLPDTDGPSGLGATVLAGGAGVLFGLYQPNAARVYVCGDFNQWQYPDADRPDRTRFRELACYRGWFGEPNMWLAVVPAAAADHEYKFAVYGGVPPRGDGRHLQWRTDPFARRLKSSYVDDNAVVVDPHFPWTDAGFRTPDRSTLILYELNVFGFTEGDGVPDAGRFVAVTRRIRDHYFTDLGVTALSLMPVSEAHAGQGPKALGYDTMLAAAVERDFGPPEDLRELVDAAHAEGLAVLVDMVLSHAGNDGNVLWRSVLERPEEEDGNAPGLYFSGSSLRWGNRMATEKRDVQNLLIDVCKMFLVEYHLDGFRFDTMNTDYMDTAFRLRLAEELTTFRHDVILVAENLPNQPDLNRSGYDGMSQWADPFHDKMKAVLREGVFDGRNFPTVDGLADIFFFCRSAFAAHTNNVVNFVENHDETSVAYEVDTNKSIAGGPATQDRKGRLGLFATMVALGQPMIYMGQEFNVYRDRNTVSFPWPAGGPGGNGFFWWASALIRLRRRYPALRISGYSPADDGRFTWILGHWMDDAHGSGLKVLGWRLRPNDLAHDTVVVLLNLEPFPVLVDLELGLRGVWVKLADMDGVNDIPPGGSNSAAEPTALHSDDGRFGGFTLPSSSGFLYKWERA